MHLMFARLCLFLTFLACCSRGDDVHVKAPWFGIHVVDEQTGRGIPLIELRTVNDVRCVTDNAGWIAFLEPGLMDREVWFYVSLSPGYEREKDGFGYTGIRVTTKPGASVTMKMKRTNIAERIARTTGQGMYRDSELLGLPCPLPNLGNAGVMGQDSEQAVLYGDKIFWLWGDTNVPRYPLGNFRTTCALTPRDVRPEQGIAFDYFTDPAQPGMPRQMLPIQDKGAVWLFGLLVVKTASGGDELFAHYGRHLALAAPVEHGITRFDAAKGVFVIDRKLDASETWRFPRGQSLNSGEHFYFADDGFLPTRVAATREAVLDPSRYEALRFDENTQQWSWQRNQAPTSQNEETKLLLQKRMPPTLARYRLKDAATGKLVRLHGGGVQWNEWRHRFILIGLQSGEKDDPSPLGEVWYAESKQPDGPWNKAVKVASHPRYSFYNPVHHAFLDGERGRVIYFEGTYSLEFSGNPMAPARYDYNQLQYRLDLADDRLLPARVE